MVLRRKNTPSCPNSLKYTFLSISSWWKDEKNTKYWKVKYRQGITVPKQGPKRDFPVQRDREWFSDCHVTPHEALNRHSHSLRKIIIYCLSIPHLLRVFPRQVFCTCTANVSVKALNKYTCARTRKFMRKRNEK